MLTSFVSWRIYCTDWMCILASSLLPPSLSVHFCVLKKIMERIDLTHVSCSFTEEKLPLLGSVVQVSSRAPTQDAYSPASDTKQGEGGCLWRHRSSSTRLLLWEDAIKSTGPSASYLASKTQPKKKKISNEAAHLMWQHSPPGTLWLPGNTAQTKPTTFSSFQTLLFYWGFFSICFLSLTTKTRFLQ